MNPGAGENSTEYEGEFNFHTGDPVYESHFPGYPVVPGSLIIHAFLKALQENGISCKGLHIQQFSFREFLAPGVCRFRIARRGGLLDCRITKDGKRIASGMLSYET